MSDKATRVWFALFVLVVFVAGLGAGILLDRQLGGRGWPPLLDRGLRPAFGGPGPGRPGRLVERLASNLQLTEDQKERLQRVFEERRKRLDRFREESRARFETEQQELRREIGAILTPQQRERFEKMIRDAPRGGPFAPGGGPSDRRPPPGEPPPF